MKKHTNILLVSGLVLIITGLIGGSSFADTSSIIKYDKNTNELSNKNENSKAYDGDNGSRINCYDKRGSKRSLENQQSYYENQEKLDMKELRKNVEEYITGYTNKLEISDIFTYENSDYYFSIIESDTRRGAMELLVNPYTGDVYPEFGPNMMWNLKYGMHYSGQSMMGNRGMMIGRGMTGNRGMMSGFDTRYSRQENNLNNTNDLSKEEVYTIGDKYVKSNFSDKYTLSEELHEFYGYYTFHIEENNAVKGMLSVNTNTGDVWYHDWHGKLENIIEGIKS